MPRALLPLLLICLLSPLPAVADERADAQRQLEQTQKDINELKKNLKNIQDEKSGVQKQLKSTETQMGDLEKQIKQIQDEMKKNEEELQRLDSEKKKLQGARLEQQRLIAIQARAAYQSGREEYLKLLLNQEHPEKFSRTLTYYDYINKARLEQLSAFNETLRQLSNVEQEITSQKDEQVAQQSALEARRQELADARKARQETLAKLNSDLKDGSSKLKDREQSQEDLNKVLKTIEETLARQAREAAAAGSASAARPGRRARAGQARAGTGGTRREAGHALQAPRLQRPAGFQRRRFRRSLRRHQGPAALAGGWPSPGALRQPARRRPPGHLGRRTDFGAPAAPSVPYMAAAWYSPTGCAAPAYW